MVGNESSDFKVIKASFELRKLIEGGEYLRRCDVEYLWRFVKIEGIYAARGKPFNRDPKVKSFYLIIFYHLILQV